MIHLYIQFYILKYFLNFILKGTLHNREKQPSPSRGASLAPEGEQGSPTVFSVFWYRQENLYKVISTTYFYEMIIPQFASFPLFSRSLSSIWIIFFYLKEILFCSKLNLRDPCLFFFFFKFSEIWENKNHLWTNSCRWDLNLVSIYCAFSIRITVLASVHLT